MARFTMAAAGRLLRATSLSTERPSRPSASCERGPLNGEAIAAIGQLRGARGRTELDARGLAVAPGFINMLSWANRSLLEDGRSQSDIRQGMTLEVLDEGSSMGPLTDTMKRQMREQQGDIKYAIEWTRLGEYLAHLVKRGVSCNVA